MSTITKGKKHVPLPSVNISGITLDLSMHYSAQLRALKPGRSARSVVITRLFDNLFHTQLVKYAIQDKIDDGGSSPPNIFWSGPILDSD